LLPAVHHSGEADGVSLRGGKDIAMVSAHVATKDLELHAEQSRKVHPQIDRRYWFVQIPDAIAYLDGHAKGG
jgi:hypothetical protein